MFYSVLCEVLQFSLSCLSKSGVDQTRLRDLRTHCVWATIVSITNPIQCYHNPVSPSKQPSRVPREHNDLRFSQSVDLDSSLLLFLSGLSWPVLALFRPWRYYCIRVFILFSYKATMTESFLAFKQQGQKN